MNDHDDRTREHSDNEWVRQQLAALPDPGLPAEVDQRLLASIRHQIATPPHEALPGASQPLAGRRRVHWLPLAAAAGLVAILGVVASGLFSEDSAVEPVVLAAGVQPVATNTSYTRDNIEAEVRSHLASLRNQQRVGQAVSEQGRRNSFVVDSHSIDGCLSALSPRSGQVDLLDMADYQGEPSGIVVFRADNQVQVFVVAPNCNREDPRVRLRLQTSLTAD